MIGRLTGRVLECTPGEMLLDVGGVGYAVQIPLGTYYQVASAPATEAVTLHVHTHVREDVLALFGFASRAEREAFEKLIAISGIGPRLALAVLSGIGADELRGAVESGDLGRLQKIPGVGKKTAERIVLELKDKFRARGGLAAAAPGPSSGSALRGRRDDAVSALSNLGYPRERAEGAVHAAAEAEGPDATLEALLKAALRRLVR